MTTKIDNTTNWLYNHFKQPYENLNIQNCKTYGDIFYNDYYGIQPNTIGCAILLDYFGIDTSKILVIDVQDKINILYGIYEGLIKFKGCDEFLLDKCLKFNKLDELINIKYKSCKSGYYQNLISNKISIGNTYKSLFNIDGDLIDKNNVIIYKKFIILDDDYCPNCNTDGFITKKNAISYQGCVPDCKKCCILICKNCSYTDNDEEPYTKTCYNCLDIDKTSSGNLKTNILKKIFNHKKYDLKRFDIEGNIDYNYITKLINKQDKKCYICKETVLIIDWKPYCCYQFSIDRIDNNMPHDKNNVLISCYYCNCRDYPKFDQHNKKCNQNCHTDYKELRHKKHISKVEINEIINNII